MIHPANRHCEPFHAAGGVAQDKLRQSRSEASHLQHPSWIASSLRSSQ
jgi:hypothetical protein